MKNIDNKLILGKNHYFSLDCYETKVNNNVLVVGTSGAGKTRCIVEPNLYQATGSYIVSDPKGNLYNKYKDYLKLKGYRVLKLDFTNPGCSEHYNPFEYIRNTQDIVKIAHMMVVQDKNKYSMDPFWDNSSQLLIQACIALLWEDIRVEERNFKSLVELIRMCEVEEDYDKKNKLDIMFDVLARKKPDSYAVKTYKKFRIGSTKTLKNVLISLNSVIGFMDTPELNKMMEYDTIDIPSIGKEKTALFVVVSDTDRSLDGLANIVFSQAMNVLCQFADNKCKDNSLPVPVRFILDDFATNVKINEFPRMIASIRSRGISTMLMIQAESQLTEAYGYDGRTIIANCDSYIYMGGNDVETARAVSVRCDVPLKKVLYMPVGTYWLFRRGLEPIFGDNMDIDEFMKEKSNYKEKQK